MIDDLNDAVIFYSEAIGLFTVERPFGRHLGYLREIEAPGDLAPTEWEAILGQSPDTQTVGRFSHPSVAVARLVDLAGVIDIVEAFAEARGKGKPVVEVVRGTPPPAPLDGRD